MRLENSRDWTEQRRSMLERMLNPIVKYYTDDYVEADRLFADGAGRLELIRTKELLIELPPYDPVVSPLSVEAPVSTQVGSSNLVMASSYSISRRVTSGPPATCIGTHLLQMTGAQVCGLTEPVPGCAPHAKVPKMSVQVTVATPSTCRGRRRRHRIRRGC
jgi:hypothetical protein